MASLATARTRLSLAGVPKQPEGSFLARVAPTEFAVSDTLSVSFTEGTPAVEAFDSRTGYTQRFSQLGLNGVSRLSGGDFTKEVITLAELAVTDTWIATFTEDPVDENQIIGTDEWRLSISDIANLRNELAVTDTLGVQSIENIGLLQSGVVLQSVTDSWSVTFTEGTGDVRVTLAVTDDWPATLTETDPSTIATPLQLVAVTDDFNVTLSGEEASLQIFAGVVPLNVLDTWTVTFSTEGAEFTVQQPIGRIAFRVLTNKIRFEFV
jgi:hypothetical protein